MKFYCTQENLNKAMMAVEKIITKNSALPVLANVLLETDNGRLKISATNLEIGTSFWIGAKIEEEGSITVPARVLASYVSKIPNKKINFESKEGNILKINSDDVEANIKGMDAKEFPIIPQLKERSIGFVKNIDFKNALISTIIASAISEVRPELSGVCLIFDFSKNNLVVVASDSYRLAEKNIPLIKPNPEITENTTIILPRNTAQELIRILDNAAETEITISTNQILFAMDGVNLISRLIDSKYPDYKQIIPTTFETEVTLETKPLINLIRIAGLFSDAQLMNVVLKTNTEQSLVEIKSESDFIGSNEAKAKAKIKGKNVEITFNYRHLLEGLGAISDSNIVIGLNGTSAPAVVKPSEAKESYQYIIMPKAV